ncbi:MAG: anti-sigma factor [Pyrinomonadaceae bacterium]
MMHCLDEVALQSYLDGELSTEAMKDVMLHLTTCASCAAVAREVELEDSLLRSALAPEFEVAVPTELLRQRIDGAISDSRRSIRARKAGFASKFVSSVGDLFGVAPQRAFGYASVIVVLAFAVIFAGVKLRTSAPAPTATSLQNVAINERANPAPGASPVRVDLPEYVSASATAPKKSRVNRRPVQPSVPAVKLFPGERTYLQTIAKLDLTINADKQEMRPGLQVEYERNLAVVDRAIAATRSAAKSNPTDPDAAEFMFAAYQSKVNLLNTIADARLGGRSH